MKSPICCELTPVFPRLVDPPIRSGVRARSDQLSPKMRSHLEGRSAGKRLRSDHVTKSGHVTKADHVGFGGDHVVGRKGGSLECIFSGIQLEVDRSVLLCQQVLNSIESGSGMSEDEPCSPLDSYAEKTTSSATTPHDTCNTTREEQRDVTLDNAPHVLDNAPHCHDNTSRGQETNANCCQAAAAAGNNNEALELELETSFHVWFQTDLSRELAEELIVKQPVGTFYIRGSSKPDHYALSVHISRTHPRVEHYLVHDSNNELQMENSSQRFPSFVKLLAFFAQSKTYSATTGIPVQLKIPRLVSSSGNPSSVYDQIELEAPRDHVQAITNSVQQPSRGSTVAAVTSSRALHVQTRARKSTHSPPSKTPQAHIAIRPKSIHVTTIRDENGDMRNFDSNGAAAPPKPPKPKHYKGNNYNLPCEKDLIYINLDKSPGKMLDVLSPTTPPQNDLSDKCRKRNKSVHFTYELRGNINNSKQGPAVFHAPPPPAQHYESDTDSECNQTLEHSDISPGRRGSKHKEISCTRRLTDPAARAMFVPPPPPSDSDTPVFIAPCPPIESASGSEEELEEDEHLGSCTGSLYSSKNSVDLGGSDSVRLRFTRSGPRSASVMDKVRSRVFKLDRTGRQSVRAKLCQKLSPHVLRLTDAQDFTFGARVNTFVTFVKQQHQKVPERLLSQIREFMCSIKHEMISHRSVAIDDMICRGQRKGGPPTKLNDVLEGILVKAVIWPLRSYIAKVLHEYDGHQCDTLKNSMTVALSKPQEELGINKELFCGEDMDWSVPVQCLQDMPNHYSPIKKLERLLACVNSIYTIVREQNLAHTGDPRSMGADEFLPLFIYVLALSGLHTAGQEVMYMQHLLDPPLLIGEPGYYLTSLASSIILLKSLNFDKPTVLPSVGHLQSMIQIHFTDPDMQEIAYTTVPINQNTRVGELLSTLAAKFRLENSEKTGLYRVEEGTETLLSLNERPQFIKNRWLVESLERDINSYFTFRRIGR